MDRQGYEHSGVTAGLPTQTTTVANDATPVGTEQYRGTEASTIGTEANTVETRDTEVTGVYVPVVPVEAAATETRHEHTEHHDAHKKPMGEKIKEKVPGTHAHKEHKAEMGRI